MNDRGAIGPVRLTGRHVALEPLRGEHLTGLLAAADDERIWSWMPARLQRRDAMLRFVDAAMQRADAGTEFTFAVVLRESESIVGSTRFMDVNSDDRGIEIGGTWYSPSVWATRVNPEAKLLLMQHAFETWGAIRVYFKTDELNERSRAAIAKLGAQYEGILRNHRIRTDGTYRGSAVYSVLEDEWPGVKTRLLTRLDTDMLPRAVGDST